MLMIKIPLIVLCVALGIWFIDLFWNPFDRKTNRKKSRSGYGCKAKKHQSIKQEHQAKVDQRARDAKVRTALIASGVRPDRVSNTLAIQAKDLKMKARRYRTIK